MLYVDTLWGTVLPFVVALGCCVAAVVLPWETLQRLSGLLRVIVGAAWLGMLGGVMRNITKKMWGKAAIQMLAFLVCGAVAIVMGGTAFLLASPIPVHEGFANNLTIPENIATAEPIGPRGLGSGVAQDGLEGALVEVLTTGGTGDSSVTADITNIEYLALHFPALFRRYLATCPAWRVFREGDYVFATRRFLIGGVWRYDLSGYYTNYALDPWLEAHLPAFQFRLTIGLSGKVWRDGHSDMTYVNAGDTHRLLLSGDGHMKQSDCVVSAPTAVVEVFEQSTADERRLTKVAFRHLNAELLPLVREPSWQTIRTHVPAGGIRHGEASFNLRQGEQPGLYNSELWINAGEAGMVYLRAYEVTKGTPLSVQRLKEDSNEYVGWSEDPKELFLSNAFFFLSEGALGEPYVARFEVWFAPETGASERKLMERIFKIQGWHG